MAGDKVIIWDIEATNLSANFGYVLAVAGKALGDSKVHCFDVSDYKGYRNDPTNDKKLVKEASEYLSEAGAWVTWYGGGFDVPYINSRLIHHGLSPMPPIPHIDGWKIAKYKLKLNSNRLASVSSFLEIEEKTKLDGPTWIKASAGNKKALDYVVEHCIQDVIVLEQAFNKIKPLITSGPNLALLNGKLKRGQQLCPICASPQLQKRGVSVTATGHRQRYQCNACGGWSRGKVDRDPEVKAS